MLVWAQVNPEENDLNRRFRSQSRNRLLRVQVLDALTGDLLAERNNLSPAFPLRCVYHQSTRELQLFSSGSIITVTEEQPDDGSNDADDQMR